LSSVPCIVLAGGLGTRLRSAVPDLPKCLAPVGDHSFLGVLLEKLFSEKIDRVVLSLGYKADMVLDAVSRETFPGVVSHVIETSPLGTGGAMLHALQSTDADEAIVVNGDTYFDGSIAAFLNPLDSASGELVRLGCIEVENRKRFGGVRLNGSQVVAFNEKAGEDPGTINAGVYRVGRDCFRNLRLNAPFSFEVDVLPILVTQGSVQATLLTGRFTDIGIPDDYHRFVASHAATG
jgi:D-glycero-alpha-D-manno-heptose 1-phosphate guanylyltransferase